MKRSHVPRATARYMVIHVSLVSSSSSKSRPHSTPFSLTMDSKDSKTICLIAASVVSCISSFLVSVAQYLKQHKANRFPSRDFDVLWPVLLSAKALAIISLSIAQSQVRHPVGSWLGESWPDTLWPDGSWSPRSWLDGSWPVSAAIAFDTLFEVSTKNTRDTSVY